jgi:nucleotide-binding universal stress UspA family protein
MRKLLVPVDSSDNAMRALKHAVGLAREHGPIELRLVHAHEPPIVYGEISVYVSEEKAREMQRRHSEEILRPAVEMAKAAGVAATSAILIGNVASSIAKEAEDGGCDGIVMGTRGLGAMGSLMLGSVAAKVVHLTKLPVTLVK